MASPQPEVAQELDWIKRAQKGDGEAFGLLVERYERRVFSLVYHLVRRREDVEDLAQEIFIKGFRSLRSYNFQASFVTWLSRVAVNHCYDYLRRLRSSPVSYYWQMSEEGQRNLEARVESAEEGGLNQAERAALQDFVGKLLDRAPANDRLILTLKEVEGYSVEEISDLLNLKPSTVKVRLHRARKRILEDLKEWRNESTG
jgi:RNA polymerase sigma-70 factor (ECF subfamily)